MPQILKNRFFPNTHEKKQKLHEFSEMEFDSDIKNQICDVHGAFPVLTICGYTLLLGYVKDNEFQGWLEKRSTTGMKTDPLRPEKILTDLVLKAVNMFPNPQVLLDRVIDRLQSIKNSRN